MDQAKGLPGSGEPANRAAAFVELRPDLALVAELVTGGARVLDVGCGHGDLLVWLRDRRSVDARGVEISQAGVNAAVARGLSVVQGDADTDLDAYPDKAFDCAILSQTLQATRKPRDVLENLLRIGRQAIVSVPNFGYWRVRAHLALRGSMPVTSNLPYSWYDTPNIHFCTLRDFENLVGEVGGTIDRRIVLGPDKRQLPASTPGVLANLFGEQAIFLLHR